MRDLAWYGSCFTGLGHLLQDTGTWTAEHHYMENDSIWFYVNTPSRTSKLGVNPVPILLYWFHLISCPYTPACWKCHWDAIKSSQREILVFSGQPLSSSRQIITNNIIGKHAHRHSKLYHIYRQKDIDIDKYRYERDRVRICVISEKHDLSKLN